MSIKNLFLATLLAERLGIPDENPQLDQGREKPPLYLPGGWSGGDGGIQFPGFGLGLPRRGGSLGHDAGGKRGGLLSVSSALCA